MDSRILGNDPLSERGLNEKQVNLRPRANLNEIIKEVWRYFSLEDKDFLFSDKDRRLSEAGGITAWLVLEIRFCTIPELRERHGPGGDDIKLSGKATADTARNGFEVGGRDEGIIGSTLLSLDISSPTFSHEFFVGF